MLFDVGEEDRAVDRAVDDQGGGKPRGAEGRQEGRRLPVAVRDACEQSGPSQRPATRPGHVGLRPGLVDEDEMVGIVVGLGGLPCDPLRRDVGAIPLGGDQDFFFKVSLIARRARHKV